MQGSTMVLMNIVTNQIINEDLIRKKLEYLWEKSSINFDLSQTMFLGDPKNLWKKCESSFVILKNVIWLIIKKDWHFFYHFDFLIYNFFYIWEVYMVWPTWKDNENVDGQLRLTSLEHIGLTNNLTWKHWIDENH